MIYNLSKLSPELRHEIESSPKWRALFSKRPDTMLRLDGNAKTVKGNKKGFKTAILYMAPANMSGENLCPMAFIAQCDSACLFTAGRGAMTSVAMSRLRKALFFQQYQAEAIAMIKRELAGFEAKAQREGWTLLVRLNGTTDIRFENYGIMQDFPGIQFYDYTKIANRKGIPANYDLTYSYSGVAKYLPYVNIAMRQGMRVAVVFRNRAIVDAMMANSDTFMGLELVDGDDTDIRHIEPQGVVVALYAKGKGKYDTTGFVVDHAPVELAMAA
jgi:hypothetical protein